jgi:hypothetical protein
VDADHKSYGALSYVGVKSVYSNTQLKVGILYTRILYRLIYLKKTDVF